MDKNQRVLINLDSLAPPYLCLSNVGTNIGESMGVLIWCDQMTSLHQSNFFQNLLEFFDWSNDVALRSIQGHINPTAPRVSGQNLFCAKNPLAATPSPLLHVLPALLSPLFMSKKLDVHLAYVQGVVMPEIEGCRTSSTSCCSNFRRSSEVLSNQILIWFLEHTIMRRRYSRSYLSGYR